MQSTPSRSSQVVAPERGGASRLVEKSLIHEEDTLDPFSRESDFIDQIGYSAMSGSNVYMDLHQLLKGETSGLLEHDSMYEGPMHHTRLENKFWALAKELPPTPITRELIEVFFSDVNWFYCILERYYFNQLYTSWLDISDVAVDHANVGGLSRELNHFLALLFQILAIALQFLSPDAAAAELLQVKDMTVRDRLGRQYSCIGMEIMTLLGRHHATLTSVQHDLLRGVWLKNCGRGTEAWHALGSAIRQAQEMNLHLQSKVRQTGTSNIGETLSRLWYDEYKRRLWVILFIWDRSHMALILGRPRIINAGDCDIKVPIDYNIPKDPSKTVPMATQAVDDSDLPSLFSSTLLQYSVSHLIHEMRTAGADKRYPKDYKVICNFHDRAASLLDNVPLVLRPQNPDTSWDSRCPFFSLQRELVLTSVDSFLLALHRPHIHAYPESRTAAVQAALSILKSQQRFLEKIPRHQRKFVWLAFNTINAASFLSVVTMMYPPTDEDFKQQIDPSLRQAISRLELLEHGNPVARTGLKLLRYCYQKIQLSSRSNNEHVVSIPVNEAARIIQPQGSSEESGIHGNKNPKLPDTEDPSRPIAFNLNDIFQQQGDMPAAPDMTESPTSNEFDASYWIEQINQIQNNYGDEPNNNWPWNSF
ncbi:MAG: hypothetical protein M1834_002845 [Cirrosporium novae-zelandiae]|nr:MAG: hypothetical protein M1834_002845 [Cirrosporium novae-zelandiae]